MCVVPHLFSPYRESNVLLSSPARALRAVHDGSQSGLVGALCSRSHPVKAVVSISSKSDGAKCEWIALVLA